MRTLSQQFFDRAREGAPMDGFYTSCVPIVNAIAFKHACIDAHLLERYRNNPQRRYVVENTRNELKDISDGL